MVYYIFKVTLLTSHYGVTLFEQKCLLTSGAWRRGHTTSHMNCTSTTSATTISSFIDSAPKAYNNLIAHLKPYVLSLSTSGLWSFY